MLDIHLLAVGRRPPDWVQAAYTTYAQRLPRDIRLNLKEIPLGNRRKGMIADAAVAEEGRRMLAALPPGCRVINLDEKGRSLTSRKLAQRLQDWQEDGRDVALLIGGPDGLAAECAQRAEFTWSLSPLTLPHALVRVIAAEQLYRAWSILAGHPYHRD